jgi:hypothetical protein
LEGNEWKKRGGDIDGENNSDDSGFSVSLSSDGNVVAIGAPYHDNSGSNNSGHVRVYKYVQSHKRKRDLLPFMVAYLLLNMINKSDDN